MSDSRQTRSDIDSATTASRSNPQYDGPETPVLIQLPDLSERLKPARPVSPPESSSLPNSAGGGQRKRRIHRSHVSSPRSETRSPVQAELRSKLFVIAVLFVVVGVTYALLHGDGDSGGEPPAGDQWAVSREANEDHSEPAPAAIEPSSSEGNFVDLWPGDNEPTEAPLAEETYGKLNSAAPESDVPLPSTQAAATENGSEETWPAAPELPPDDSQEFQTSWPASSLEQASTRIKPENSNSESLAPGSLEAGRSNLDQPAVSDEESGWPEADSATLNHANGQTVDRSGVQYQGAQYQGAQYQGGQHGGSVVPSAPAQQIITNQHAPYQSYPTPADSQMSNPATISGVSPTNHERSTARLDGNIEHFRPATSHEQPTTTLY